MTPEESEALMMAKVRLLNSAFGLSDGHALNLLQAAGANYEIAYDAYLEAGDKTSRGTYGVPATATEIASRLETAQAIARTKTLQTTKTVRRIDKVSNVDPRGPTRETIILDRGER
jgi:ethanolamine utilization microcompartment shell protein EutL